MCHYGSARSKVGGARFRPLRRGLDQERSLVPPLSAVQAGLVRGVGGLEVREHDTFHHNVPMFLEREGQLVPLIKRSLLRLLRPQ